MHDFLQGDDRKKERLIFFNILFTGDGNTLLTLVPYLPSRSTFASHTESTAFDQVYAGQRRRPAMISLNVQWLPVNNRSGTYQWNGNDLNSRKVKTVTFFGTGEMRGQRKMNAVTPPSSDYTDAYLSAFAAKPIPTRQIHRLSTAVFGNSVPIPLKPTSTPVSISSSMKTSQTRLINVDNRQPSSALNKPVPPPSDRSSTYSSSFVPARPTTYEPFSRTQYSLPQSQTFTSNYSTLHHASPATVNSASSPSTDSQRSYTTFQTRTQPSPSIYSPTYRSPTAFESIYKPMPPYSPQSYPPSNTYTTSLSSLSTESKYKPYVPFQSVPLSSSYNTNQSSTIERIVLPSPSITKPVDRPETLLFQSDEDLRSSRIEKPSPLLTPSPQSPMIREEIKVAPESSPTEELIASTSEPIKILENTLSKYDSLISQISEVLASVSPLSSTLSSMSPGKSVLDYQLSLDNSPILSRKRVDAQPSQQPTTTSTVEIDDGQQARQSHLIRRDSYDKIVTAITDLDNNIVVPKESQKSASTIEEEDETKTPQIVDEEEKRKSNISSSAESLTQLETEQQKEEQIETASTSREERAIPFLDEQQLSSASEEQTEEKQNTTTEEQSGPSVTEEEQRKFSISNEYQISPVTEDETNEDTQTALSSEQPTISVTEERKDETKTASTDQSEVPSTTEVEKEEETNTLPVDEERVASTSEQPTASATEETKNETKTISTHQSVGPLALDGEKEEEPKALPIDEERVASTSEQSIASLTEETKDETKTISTDQSEASSTTEVENQEETKASPVDEQRVASPSEQSTASFTEETKDETKTISTDQSEASSTTEEQEETKASPVDEERVASTSEQSTASVTEETKDETKTTSTDQSEASSTTEEQEETKASPVDEERVASTSEQSIASLTEETKDETKTTSTDQSEASSTTEVENQEETKASPVDEERVASTSEQSIASLTEETKDETKTTSTDQSKASSATEEEKEEETKALPIDEEQVSSTREQSTASLTEETTDETKTTSTDQSAIPSAPEEEKKVETKTLSTDEQQTASSSEQPTTPVAEATNKETKTFSTDQSTIPSTTDEEKEGETEASSTKEQETVSTSEEQNEETTTISTTNGFQTPFVNDEEKQEETTSVSLDESLVATSATDDQGPLAKEEETPKLITSSSAEENEKTKTDASDIDHPSLGVDEEKEETKTSLPDEQQAPSVLEEAPSLSTATLLDTSAAEVYPFNDKKDIDEQSIVATTESLQQQTDLLSEMASDVSATENQEASDAVISAKKAGKHVTWDETVVDNEDDDSSSQQSLTEESSTPAVSITTTAVDDLKTTTDQNLISPEIIQSPTIFEKATNRSTGTSSTDDQQVFSPESVLSQTNVNEQQITSLSLSEDGINLATAMPEQVNQIDKTGDESTPSDSTEQHFGSSSSFETTASTFSDSTDQQSTLSEVTESPISLSERQFHSPSSPDTQSISTIDSSKDDTFTFDEVSRTISDVVTDEGMNTPVDESEVTKTVANEKTTSDEDKLDTSSQVVESSPQEFEVAAIQSTTAPLELKIVSPVETLVGTVSNRYISSDVYHGYLGDHKGLQNLSDVDDENTKKSLLASLRETITTPITPLIETIQSVISGVQTTSATHLSKSDSETIDSTDDATRLTSTTVVTESIEEETGDKTPTEEDKSVLDTSEKLKTVFDNLREAVTAPITAITETIQTAVSNLQSDKEEVSSTSGTEPLSASLEEKVSIVESEPSSTIVDSSDEKIDDHGEREGVRTPPSLIESIQENVSKTISTLSETIQNAVSTNTSLVETHAEDEQVVKEEKSDAQTFEQNAPTDTTRDETMDNRQKSYDSFATDTAISTSSDNAEEPASSKISESISADQKIESSEITPLIQSDEQVSATSATALEQADTSDKQHAVSINSSSADILAEEKTIETSVSTSSSEHDESVSTSTTLPAEQIDFANKQDTVASEMVNEASIEQKLDEDVSVEPKTTLEVIRDMITHPITTITEKLQSITPGSDSEQVVSDTAEIFKEQQISETEETDIVKQKDELLVAAEHAESSETKTTFETIRDVITHPIATISEKIQSIVSPPNTEQVSSDVIKPTKSSEDQSSLETTNADFIEENFASPAESKNVESTESKTTFETFRDAITHPIATITEKMQSVISPSTTEEVPSSEKEIDTDQNKYEDARSTVTETPSDTLTNRSIITNETVGDVVSTTADQTSSAEVAEQIRTTQKSELYTEDQIHSEQETAPRISVSERSTLGEVQGSVSEISADRNQLLVDTIRDLINDTINSVISNLSENTVDNELIDDETFSWNNLLDEKLNQSSEEIKPEDVALSLDNIISSQTLTKPQAEDVMQRSSIELETDSTAPTTEIENVPATLSTEYREPSPVNTEDDSLELIHALHGHSIVQTPTTSNQTSIVGNTGEQNLQTREKSSSSTTTSSQVTSSDRYVSYAIHEMGDSSQERLPPFPLIADIPVYQSVKTISEENKEQQIPSAPIANVNQNLAKDDDLTELDATENLTSYSDEIQIQKLRASTPNREKDLDASSTDEDVDDEFDQPDVSNLHRIVGEMTQQSSTLSGDYGETYQRYDLSSTSSMSTKPQTDDIYIIPGYPGLWKPSADDVDDDCTHSSFTNDADDEDEKKPSNSTVKTRTIVRTANPAKLQSFLQQAHELTPQDIPLRPDSIDIFNRPLNEFPFELSESDSFKTCASTLNSSSTSKQQKPSELFQRPSIEEHEHQASPEEKIFLIRERERGVSLPVTMKIDYDDMALRLSTSTPIDTEMYSSNQPDLSSPSTHSEPMHKTISSSSASTPSLSGNESEQQKFASSSSSSWLNTVNTITTTLEGPDGPLEARTTVTKSSKGPVSVAECDALGKYVLIENTSRSKSIALAGWTIRQENDNGDRLTFTFPDNCLLRPNQSFKILTKANESERRNSDLIASSLSSWHTDANVLTTLINVDGKDRASLTKKTLFS